MKVFRSGSSFKKFRAQLKGSVGFVPTMGALHEGHLRLAQKSLAQCDHTIVSIFVNPTQFNNPEDFKKYPQTLKGDFKLLKNLRLKKHCIAAVFLPTFASMYPDQFRFQMSENEESKVLCGAHRPGHFTGVLTVVLKLLNIVRPARAYFGEKDFQQLKLIRDMAAAFFLDCKIVPVATVREKKGLALSSRNARLSAAGLERARLISQLLQNKQLPPQEILAALKNAGMKVDYVEDHWQRRFVAAHVEGVRLIDNVVL